MTDIIIKIMTEVLNIFAIATKDMGQGRASTLILAILSSSLIFPRKNDEKADWKERD